MADDIVDRLRAGALSGDLPLGAAFDWERVAAEIERLRAEVEAWRTAAQGAGVQVVQLRELLHALDIRMVQPFMSGGGQFSAHGTLTADQWAIIADAFEEGK